MPLVMLPTSIPGYKTDNWELEMKSGIVAGNLERSKLDEGIPGRDRLDRGSNFNRRTHRFDIGLGDGRRASQKIEFSPSTFIRD